jgi:hypothetical protein
MGNLSGRSDRAAACQLRRQTSGERLLDLNSDLASTLGVAHQFIA